VMLSACAAGTTTTDRLTATIVARVALTAVLSFTHFPFP